MEGYTKSAFILFNLALIQDLIYMNAPLQLINLKSNFKELNLNNLLYLFLYLNYYYSLMITFQLVYLMNLQNALNYYYHY